jgi:hypothetical protein
MLATACSGARRARPCQWGEATVVGLGSSPSWLNRAGRAHGLVLGALMALGRELPLAAQSQASIMVEATVVSAEGTRSFQLVRRMLRTAPPSTIPTNLPGDPAPLATISIDSAAALPGSTSRRIVVNIQYLRN